jgi:hypothetical protein
MALGLPRIRPWRGKLRQNCLEFLHLRNELLVVPYLQFKPTLLNLLLRRVPQVKVVRNEHVDTTHSCKCNQGIGPVPEGALATSLRSVQLASVAARQIALLGPAVAGLRSFTIFLMW